MLVKEFEWKKESRMNGEVIIFTANTNAGRFTVFERITRRCDGCIPDTETGFNDKDGMFWLASGMFDIRMFPELSLSEAVDMVKKESNICVYV